jgi:hypothetical protein
MAPGFNTLYQAEITPQEIRRDDSAERKNNLPALVDQHAAPLKSPSVKRRTGKGRFRISSSKVLNSGSSL